jgi:signal transduction histidine kinase
MEKISSGIFSLIVDDDIDFAKSIFIYLEDIGIKSLLISDSSEAIAYIKNNKVDILILDLMMPKLNGIEIIKEVRKKEKYLPIIVISGTGSINFAVEAIKLGADDFISKPIIDFKQLEISIEKVIDKALLQHEVSEYRKNLESLVKLRTAQVESKNKELENINKNLEEEIKKRKKAEKIVKKGVLDIIAAVEDERKRLSKELHDSVGQKLMFSKLNIELVQKASSNDNEMLNSAVEYLNQIGNDIYNLIRSLYPSSIEKYSLQKNIESLIKSYQKVIPAKINLLIEGRENALGNDIKLNMYRIYQEALNNISKHSSANEVNVSLKFLKTKISGKIENDGIINNKHNEITSGIGIFTMQERINKLNGKFFVDKSDTNYFKIIFDIPV